MYDTPSYKNTHHRSSNTLTNTMTSISPAELIYFQPPPDGSKPYTFINADPKTGVRDQNWIRETHTDIPIENLRGKEDSVTLDTAGFQYFRQPVQYTAFANDEETEREYYPESIELVKRITGASRIVPFDHSTLSLSSACQCVVSRT